ncbi:hypothetical protein GCM10022291_20250 [Postechiella marina]|uniref:Lipoprotein n=1 Tax=Postechiella marina TaxID=943941 RepID=A0ABP8C9Y2_9FLAO
MLRVSKCTSILFFIFLLIFVSCTVKETIVFNNDGTGNYLISYNMANAMKQMQGVLSQPNTKGNNKGKVVDTLVVFKEIIETYKDSVAALPEEKRLALEAVKDMYMKMNVDEEKGILDLGIGLNFNSIEELKGIEKKIEKVRSLNSQNNQVSAIKSASPLGKYMGNDDGNVSYTLSNKTFSREAIFENLESAQEVAFDEGDKEFATYFENAFYIIEYTFPKKIKSYSKEGAQLSNDRRTIKFQSNWLDFIKKPKTLDIVIKFEDE